jgi:hypothetical protein
MTTEQPTDADEGDVMALAAGDWNGVGDPADAASYNYVHFDRYIADRGDDGTGPFRASFRVGERAADFALLRLDDGDQVTLSELWRSTPLVMEFGSFT